MIKINTFYDIPDNYTGIVENAEHGYLVVNGKKLHRVGDLYYWWWELSANEHDHWSKRLVLARAWAVYKDNPVLSKVLMEYMLGNDQV
jgi:hypothetical protein